MAVQFGTVDGLVNITNESIICFVKGIDAFESLGGTQYAKNKGISFGAAFQRFMDPVYQDSTKSFMLSSIDNPVYTKSGTEQSPARGTFCRKMGLAEIDESNDVFQKTPLAKAILNGEITIKEYAFILLSKMGIFTNGVYVDNVLRYIAMYFRSNSILSPNLLLTSIKNNYNDSNIVKTRVDIIINALVLTGLITKVNTDVYVLSGTKQAEVFINYYLHSPSISKAVLDNSESYSEYVGNMEYGGIFDILPYVCMNQYDEFFPNLKKYIKTMITNGFNQQIFYGAPGTGKSNTIKRYVDDRGLPFERTTFHPDSDYSTFVGSYKPKVIDMPVLSIIGEKAVETGRTEKKIVYEFVPQAFLKAYTGAWKNQNTPFFLIIEEINRGNCAQIFGDIFQLLDRKDGVSEYPITPDEDIQKFLLTDEKYGFAGLSEEQKAGIPTEILSGEIMRLPKNLHIWATMNTSDQSLFPIDSAFKRRWDWVYIPIDTHKEDWYIKVNDIEYSWPSFLDKINDEVLTDETAEDKHLGFYFCKAEGNIISVEKFVSKLLFYLWNDVFKVYGVPEMLTKGDKNMTFHKFYNTDGTINETLVAKLLDNIGVEKKVKEHTTESASDETASATE